MRIAIFSDVHGNSLALDAVLADIERVGGVEAYWFVGDAASQGVDPAGCVARISALPGLKAVRGNTDRATTDDVHEVDDEFVALANANRERAQFTFRMVSNFFWTRGALAATGGLEWVAGLPVEARATLPDGTRVLLVHASPGRDDGDGVTPEHSAGELEALLAPAAADLVIVGHTHIPLDRTTADVRVWNLGSVSIPKTDDKRAMWTLLEAGETGYTLSRQYAEYDAVSMLARLEAVRQPAAAIISKAWE